MHFKKSVVCGINTVEVFDISDRDSTTVSVSSRLCRAGLCPGRSKRHVAAHAGERRAERLGFKLSESGVGVVNRDVVGFAHRDSGLAVIGISYSLTFIIHCGQTSVFIVNPSGFAFLSVVERNKPFSTFAVTVTAISSYPVLQ